MTISADIDGRSILHIDGHNAYWTHLTQAAPGRHNDANAPTQIGKSSWLPDWPQPGENRDCGCKSSVFHGVSPALPSTGPITFKAVSCREKCSGTAGGGKATIIFDDDQMGSDSVYVVTLTFYVKPRGSLAVQLSTPVKPAKVAVGGAVVVTAKVTAKDGPVDSISLGKGLSVSNGDAVVSASPTGLSGFSLGADASRSFSFTVKGAKEGTAALSVTATGKAGSKAVRASDSTDVKVTAPGIVVNTLSDSSIDPAALDADPRRCEIVAGARDPECSLRAAIELVNKLGGERTITFDIPGGGVPRIEPKKPLPAVTAGVTIDGTSQPGGWVELSGVHAGGGDGLTLEGGKSTVRGFVINGFASGAGVMIAKGDGDVVAGNRIGTDPTGKVAVPNQDGVSVQVAPDTTIGGVTGTAAGACAGDCNLLSGNARAQIFAVDGSAGLLSYRGLKIEGNWVGVDVTGRKTLLDSRQAQGIHVETGEHTLAAAADSVVIGGTTTRAGLAPGNLVAAPFGAIFATTYIPKVADAFSVRGNLVGLDPAGEHAVGHGTVGIEGRRISVGGPKPGDANVIGGFAVGARLTGSIVEGNLIGTNAAGTAAVENRTGLVEYDGGDNVADNVISGNHIGVNGEGVVLTHGNLIGLARDGTTALPNDIGVAAAFSNIGAFDCHQDPCNVISGNRVAGIRSQDGGYLTLEGTYVGTDRSGLHSVPNGVGVDLSEVRVSVDELTAWTSAFKEVVDYFFGHGNSFHLVGGAPSWLQIGGASPAATAGRCTYPCTIVAGNRGAGIKVQREIAISSSTSTIRGSWIGVGADGKPLPNGGAGLDLTGKPGVNLMVVGGDSPADGNVLAGGASPAVRINSFGEETSSVSILSNLFEMQTTAAPIARPVIPGAPILDPVTVAGGIVKVTGTVTAGSGQTVELYAGTACATGVLKPVGAFAVPSSLTGSFEVDLPLTALAGAPYITALHTDKSGDTSLFTTSCRQATGG